MIQHVVNMAKLTALNILRIAVGDANFQSTLTAVCSLTYLMQVKRFSWFQCQSIMLAMLADIVTNNILLPLMFCRRYFNDCFSLDYHDYPLLMLLFPGRFFP